MHHRRLVHAPHGYSTASQWSVFHGYSIRSADKFRPTWSNKQCWIRHTCCCKPAFPACSAVEVRQPEHLLLHLHMKVTRNNGLMAVFHIILWNNAFILHPFFIKEINGIGFLRKGVSDVLFILPDLFKSFRTPLRFPSPGKNAVRFQATPNLEQACPFQVFPVDPLYHLSLHRLYDQVSFPSFV